MDEKIKLKIENFLKQKTLFLKANSLIKDKHLSEQEFEEFLYFLSKKNKPFWLYLDRNEYKGSRDDLPYEVWLKQKQSQERQKDKIFGSMNAALKYSNHQRLSNPVFITWKEIKDIPSYIHVIKPTFLNNEWNIDNLNHNTMQSMRSFVEPHYAKNKDYENKKSKWMNDVEKSILF